MDDEKKSVEYTNTEAIFKSVDRSLSHEYLDWWEAAFSEFIQMYRDAEQDGTEDALRCRMIAAARMAQLGLSMFNFFGSAATVIVSGDSDRLACEAVSKVVSMLVEKKVDGWVTKSKKALN